MNALKTYEKKKEQIKALKRISDTEKQRLLFNNWTEYIFNCVPKEANEQVFSKLQNEIANT